MKRQTLKLKTQKLNGSNYRIADAEIKVPHNDTDLRLVLPSGETVTLQYRIDGDYPTLDICFSQEREVHNWAREMQPAPSAAKRQAGQHIRKAFQLCAMLDPKGEAY